MIAPSETNPVIERHLLIQLGGRMRARRKELRIGTVELAGRAGISRMTLSAIEAGEPSPSMGNYLRVMSALGVLDLLADVIGQTSVPAETRGVPSSLLIGGERHEIQDLKSLAIHEAAVREIKKHPEVLVKISQVLARWQADSPDSRSMPLWLEWQDILASQAWRKVLSSTQRAKQLRQASPLGFALSEETRRKVLKDVHALRADASTNGI